MFEGKLADLKRLPNDWRCIVLNIIVELKKNLVFPNGQTF